jgi:hypothetical protein
MLLSVAEKTGELVIVAAGALLTLLLGGALLYWIDRERRDLDAQRRQVRDDSLRPDAQEKPDESSGDQSPGS